MSETKAHVHDLEYGQVGEDFQHNVMQVRCRACGYQSYAINYPPLRTRA